MLQLYVLSLRDRAADAFGTPSFHTSVGAATRAFADEVNRPPTPDRPNVMYDHPEDFDLYSIGLWDDSEGRFIIEGPPRMVAVGKDVSVRKQQG